MNGTGFVVLFFKSKKISRYQAMKMVIYSPQNKVVKRGQNDPGVDGAGRSD